MSAGPILGAVLAGGRASRFGSDKALAELGGASLLARALASLGQWCDEVVIVGRASAGDGAFGTGALSSGAARCLPDWPGPGLGPLGGVAAALRHAGERGFASVLTSGVDCVPLPDDLLSILSPAPAYLENLPVIGHWHSNAASIACAILQSEGRRSMIAFAKAAGARPRQTASAPANINTPADLAAMETHHGIRTA